MQFNINDRFTKELPADPVLANTRRQVEKACFSYVTPKKTRKPEILHVSPEMLSELGLSEEDLTDDVFLNVFTGNSVLPNTRPYAMCYGGHQFGNWAGQLGDGRAINLAEVKHKNKHWTLQLKGAGETPYSRTADGLAVLRSSIREYLCSEAMYHLGVPTTRALTLALTGDEVMRDMLYDGNRAYEQGAIVGRVAPSFIRFGSFQIHSASGDTETLKVLVEHTVRTHFPSHSTNTDAGLLAWLCQIAEDTALMIAHWMRVGFVHGVMNTDNMSIHGLTIDYGPYGWIEAYDPNWTPNTTDLSHRRYRFSNQPRIAGWNVARLLEAIAPLLNEPEQLSQILDVYFEAIGEQQNSMWAGKLGFDAFKDEDVELVRELNNLLQLVETDMTIFFRLLSDLETPDVESLKFAFSLPCSMKFQ